MSQAAESIVKTWLNNIVTTADARDHAAHMNLISSSISLTGIPGFEQIGYEQWSQQCESDFADGIITKIEYQGLKIRAATDERIMFITRENISTNDGNTQSQGIECLLEKESDGQWRLLQQRVLGDDETAQYLDR